ncbi:MAG TPA: hypothetical protein PKG71_02980 [Candidatus Woesebacteria bacterium]|nr:hypothetical protein [Candidatus Woesebacteria bacterium]
MLQAMRKIYASNDADGFSWDVAYGTEHKNAHAGYPTDSHSRYNRATFGPDDIRDDSHSITNTGLYEALRPHMPSVKSSLASARSNMLEIDIGHIATWDEVLHVFDAGQFLAPYLVSHRRVDPNRLPHAYLVLAKASTGMVTGLRHMLKTVFNRHIQKLDQVFDDEQVAQMKQIIIRSDATPMANYVNADKRGERPIRRVCPAPWGMISGILDVARSGKPHITHTDLFTESLGIDGWDDFRNYTATHHRERLVDLYGKNTVLQREL